MERSKRPDLLALARILDKAALSYAIIGGVAGLAIGALHMDWRVKFAVVLIPALTLIVLLLTTGRFPKTERAAAGIPASEMFRACLTPSFLLWFLSMFLTSAAELAPGQWVDLALTRTVGMRGIWLLVYVSGMMFVLRHFAGPIAHRISNLGMLWGSVVLATAVGQREPKPGIDFFPLTVNYQEKFYAAGKIPGMPATADNVAALVGAGVDSWL